MVKSFLAGALTGGLIVWIWKDDIQERLDQRTRATRARVADGLHAVSETAESALDHAATPLRRAERLLEHGKTRLGTNLKAAEDSIRP